MPALTIITANDRESTPVTHSFSPDGEENGVFRFVETDGVPVGDNVLTVSKNVTPAQKRKLRVRLAMPVTVTETVNGVDSPKIVRTAYADFAFTFDKESTLQERKNLVGLMAGLLASSEPSMNEVLTELKGFY